MVNTPMFNRKASDTEAMLILNADFKVGAAGLSLLELKAAGILDSRQEGTMTFYWVVDTRVYEVLELVDQMMCRERRAPMRTADTV